MNKDIKYPSRKVTVVIRNDGPMIHCGDSPSYRTVSFYLTAEQHKLLGLKCHGSQSGNDFYEEISRVIINCDEVDNAK